MENTHFKEVFIVDGARTPFLKAKGKPGPFAAADLAVAAGKALLLRQPFLPAALDEVIIGCVMPSEDEANIARVISLRLGCGKTVPAWTVQRNCASGMQALDCAFKDIACGRHHIVLAGGTEAMSQAPLLYSKKMVNWLAGFYGAKTLTGKLRQLIQLRPSFFVPVIALLKGLRDPIVNLSMGQTAEILAEHFQIDRPTMDSFALHSHQRVCSGQQQNHFSEIVPIYDTQGNCYLHDDGVRADTNLEKLAKLPPFFDKPFGLVTAGNSSQVTDGAALLLLASREAVDKYQLPIMARIIDVEWAGVEPAEMGLGPVYATSALMKRHHLQTKDIDYWEINEAFAAQVLACLKAWEDETYCKENLHLTQALGSVDHARLNIDGGGIALGHPVGASGARIVLHLAHVLQRQRAQRGIATMCIGGGQGGTMLIESA